LAEVHGHRDAMLIHKQAAKLVNDIGARKPGMANLTKSVMQKLFKFAIKEGWRDDNPFLGIDHFKRGTHHTWTEGELKTFETKWPLGTRQRLAYSLLLYTGQRVGDVAKMKRVNIVGGELHVIQDKTGAELYLSVVPEFGACLEGISGQGPVSDRSGKRQASITRRPVRIDEGRDCEGWPCGEM
jgi:integrase